jgi:hypothetical protein
MTTPPRSAQEQYLIDELTRKHGSRYTTTEMSALRGYAVSREIEKEKSAK